MRLFRHFILLLLSLSLTLPALAQAGNVPVRPGRDPKQPIDEEYTAKIKEYTTEPFFNSPVTDYLPASKTVPTPKAPAPRIRSMPANSMTALCLCGWSSRLSSWPLCVDY